MPLSTITSTEVKLISLRSFSLQLQNSEWVSHLLQISSAQMYFFVSVLLRASIPLLLLLKTVSLSDGKMTFKHDFSGKLFNHGWRRHSSIVILWLKRTTKIHSLNRYPATELKRSQVILKQPWFRHKGDHNKVLSAFRNIAKKFLREG